MLPAGRSARFEVLDGKGRVFGDALPFRPNHYRLAKHNDGSVIAGFADLRLNSLVRREEDTPEPIRIFRDGRVIYAADKVWNFGLAPDGSAFFVIEPGADHTSQLVIHNLAEGSEHQYDLGYKYTSSFNELPYGVQFSITGEQVMMVPSENGGGESFLFFPADGSASRTIPLEGPRYAIFESMKYGYVVVWQGKDQPNLIQKKQLRWNASQDEPESVDVWSRPIDLEHFYGTMSLSNDGAWLILNAWVIHVLDTSTGETVFTFPIARPYEEQQLARLSTVLKPGATVRDLGGVGSSYILDRQLLMYRRVSRRGGTRATEYFFDVFDMDGIQLDSKPVFRVAVNPNRRCQTGDFPLRGLQVVNGALTYLSQERRPDQP